MIDSLCVLLLAISMLPGCKRSSVEPEVHAVLPSILAARVSDNPENLMSAVVNLSTKNGGFASVEITRDSVFDHVTPFFPITSDSVAIPILGLRPGSQYILTPKILSVTGGTVTGSPLEFSAPPPPGDLPQFTILHSDSPTVRFVMVGMPSTVPGSSYAVILDTGAHPVWYKKFGTSVVDFQKQPNGRYTAWSATVGTGGHFNEFDALGTITNTYETSNNLDTDPHELRVIEADYVLFGLDFRTVDLTAYGGLRNASVKGIVVEYHRSGQQPLLWNTFDHFSVTDGASDASLTVRNVNPWHGNAIEIDADGNLLVSFRNMDEITKINSQTGDVMWRMGGKQNEFTFLNDDLNGFSHQHGIRRLANGNIILFDNGNLHSPPRSRAVEYRVDEAQKIAELVWEYRAEPPLFGSALGFAQRLSNGNTLICFGTAQRVIEVDQTGRKRWEMTQPDSTRFMYRAFAIESLY